MTTATAPVPGGLSNAPESPFRFRYPLRVRFAETDGQGVVFNGNYWTYTDTAIVEYMRAIGRDYRAMVQGGFDYVVAESKCRFVSGAVFDEWLAVDVRTVHMGRTSWVVEFRISSQDDGRMIALAQNGYVFVTSGSVEKAAIPEAFREAVLEFEGGLAAATPSTPMLDSLTGAAGAASAV